MSNLQIIRTKIIDMTTEGLASDIPAILNDNEDIVQEFLTERKANPEESLDTYFDDMEFTHSESTGFFVEGYSLSDLIDSSNEALLLIPPKILDTKHIENRMESNNFASYVEYVINESYRDLLAYTVIPFFLKRVGEHLYAKNGLVEPGTAYAAYVRAGLDKNLLGAENG